MRRRMGSLRKTVKHTRHRKARGQRCFQCCSFCKRHSSRQWSTTIGLSLVMVTVLMTVYGMLAGLDRSHPFAAPSKQHTHSFEHGTVVTNKVSNSWNKKMRRKYKEDVPRLNDFRWIVLGVCPSSGFAQTKVMHNVGWIQRLCQWFPSLRYQIVDIEPFFDQIGMNYSDIALHEFVIEELSRMMHPLHSDRNQTESSKVTNKKNDDIHNSKLINSSSMTLQIILHNNCPTVDAAMIRRHYFQRHSKDIERLRLPNLPVPPEYPTADDTRVSQLGWTSHQIVDAQSPPRWVSWPRNQSDPFDQVGSISVSDRYSNRWMNDSYWHNEAVLLPLDDGRPMVIEEVGEVYSMASISHTKGSIHLDASMQRCLSWPRQGCVSMAWVQGIFQRDESYSRFHPAHRSLMNYSRLSNADDWHFIEDDPKPDQPQPHPKVKKLFCAMAVKSFYHSSYYIDSVIRHVFRRRLMRQSGQYCHMIGSMNGEQPEQDEIHKCSTRPRGRRDGRYSRFHPSGHHLLSLCFSDFRFAITMENTRVEGYTSEKVFTGLLAKDTVPVYFGNPRVSELLNTERMIICNVSDDSLIQMRRDWKQTYQFEFQSRVNFSRKPVWHREGIMDWVEQRVGEQLDPCVAKVLALERDPSKFEETVRLPALNRPFQGTHYDSSVLAYNFLQLLSYLKSPLFGSAQLQ